LQDDEGIWQNDLIHKTNCRRAICKSKLYMDLLLAFHSSRVGEQRVAVTSCHTHTGFCASICKYRPRFGLLVSKPSIPAQA